MGSANMTDSIDPDSIDTIENTIEMEGVVVTPLKRINNSKGDILHAMKKSDPGYVGFGEAYFTHIKFGEVKGWKKHRMMTLNLTVPLGGVVFVLYDDREESGTKGRFYHTTISPNHDFRRLTVPPGIWMAFKGVGKRNQSLILNIADLEHDPGEAENAELERFPFDWGSV